MSTLKIRHEIDSSTVRAISLWQPWASLVTLKLKQYETRSWKTNYRGKLLICSTAPNPLEHQQYLKICDQLQLPPWENFPHGCAIAICELTDCIHMTAEFISMQSAVETLCGDWQLGRYAWKLENIQPIEPFAVKGKQGLFNISLPQECIKCSVSTQVLEDGATSREKIDAETTSRIQVTSSPSGSLYRYLKNVLLKSGEIASYPRIQGDRDPENLKHWYWGYNYKVLEGGNWKTKSLSLTRNRVSGVRHMIEKNAPITAIRAFIKVLEDDNADSLEREFDETTEVLIAGNRRSDFSEGNHRKVLEDDNIDSLERKLTGSRPKKVLEDDNIDSLERKLTGSRPKKVLEDDNIDSLERPQASGSLYRYLKNKKLKSGAVASYPAIEGVRDPDNPNHWYWGYSYEVLEDGDWKGRSLSIPRHKVRGVQAMIGSHRAVNEIRALIEG